MRISPASRAATAGLVAALSCTLLYLNYLVPVVRFSALFLLSLLPVALACERRYADASLAFAASAVLSGLLFRAPDTWLLYVAFFGWYGIFREFAITKLNRVWTWIVLAAAFNASFFLLYFLAAQLFVNVRIPPALLIPAAEAAFMLFEILFGLCREYYAAHIRKLMFRRG